MSWHYLTNAYVEYRGYGLGFLVWPVDDEGYYPDDVDLTEATEIVRDGKLLWRGQYGIPHDGAWYIPEGAWHLGWPVKPKSWRRVDWKPLGWLTVKEVRVYQKREMDRRMAGVLL